MNDTEFGAGISGECGALVPREDWQQRITETFQTEHPELSIEASKLGFGIQQLEDAIQYSRRIK